jgi:multidrug transporter EmrE-like cation transporter
MFNVIALVTVAFLWGGTNPLIKRGSQGVEKIKGNSKFQQWLLEMKFLITRWQYIVPFAMNQSGSVLYVLTLQDTDLSLAVPLANGLSFVFTAIVARLLNEQKANLSKSRFKNAFHGFFVVV